MEYQGRKLGRPSSNTRRLRGSLKRDEWTSRPLPDWGYQSLSTPARKPQRTGRGCEGGGEIMTFDNSEDLANQLSSDLADAGH